MTGHPATPETSGLGEYQRLLILLDERRFEEAQVRGRVLLERGDISLLARTKTHNLLCWTFVEGLKRAAAEATLHGEEAVRLAAALGERSMHAQALCNLASAQYQLGNWDIAGELYQELMGILETDPGLVPFGKVLAQQGLAQLALVKGDPAEALRLLDAAKTCCTPDGAGLLLADLDRRRVLAFLALGDPERAAAVMATVDEDAFPTNPRGLWWKTHVRFTRTRVELARGHWVTARTMAANTLALARELGDLPVVAECLCLQALVDQAEGRKEAGRRARAALTSAIASGRRDVTQDVRERLKDLLATGI